VKLFPASARHLDFTPIEATAAVNDFQLSQASQLSMRFARLCGWWDLTQREQAALIGVPENILPLRLSTHTPRIQNRIEGLVKVWLHSRQAALTGEWLRRRSNLLGGLAPLQVIAQSDAGIEDVLNALRTATGRDNEP
jgi:hypothetical protein